MARNDERLAEIEARILADEMMTDEEKAETIDRARAHVAEQRKKKAIDALFAAAVREAEREHNIDEQLEDFMVDLPKFSPMIKIDNVGYFHGLTYEVPYSQARSMAEIQARAWEHQNEIDGRKRRGDEAMRPRLVHLSDSNGALPASRINSLASMRSM